MDAISTVRPVSIARIRVIANCCSGCPVPPYVALLVWTMRTCAPPLITSEITLSYASSKQITSP